MLDPREPASIQATSFKLGALRFRYTTFMTEALSEDLESLLSQSLNGADCRDALRHRYELGRRLVEQQSQRSLRDWERVLSGRVSRSYLYRCTVAYRLGTAFPSLLESKRLKVSHLDAVEHVPRARQQQLLKEAEDRGWSVRRLREEARGHVQSTRASCTMATVRHALEALCDSLATLEEQEALVSEVGSRPLAEVGTRLAQAHARVEFLLKPLKAHDA